MNLLPQLNILDLFAQLVSIMLNSKTKTKHWVKIILVSKIFVKDKEKQNEQQ